MKAPYIISGLALYLPSGRVTGFATLHSVVSGPRCLLNQLRERKATSCSMGSLKARRCSSLESVA